MILEKKNNLKLTRPRVIIDTDLSPKPKHPLPKSNGFCINIVGPAGTGKTSVMLSMVKSRDGYKKRFHNIITVIPASSLDSLAVNPFDKLDASQKFDELDFENLEEIIEQVEDSRAADELTLLLLDDCSAELQDPILLKKMMRLYLNRRHLKLSIISISHSLTGKGALPYTIRKNCSHLLLFKPSSALDALNVEYLNLPRKQFRQLTDYVFQKKHDHLFIELHNNTMYKIFNTISFGQREEV